MSSMIFSELLSKFTTWSTLSEYLTSEAGGSLRIDDHSTAENPFALIRYVKGKSNLALPHVRAFRSVVWDTLMHRPVSVTPFKSVDGESSPASLEGYDVEQFLDGVLIGVFFDKYNNKWRLHTRSTLDANCRYYSQTKTFSAMFYDALPNGFGSWPVNMSASYILQHPENRVVTPVSAPSSTLIQMTTITADGSIHTQANPALLVTGITTPDLLYQRLADLNMRFRHNVQGYIIKNRNTGERYKMRTSEYNRVRQLRGNSARRDYLWLSAWRDGSLAKYLALYPEERLESDKIVNQWKRATNDVFHIYTDVFKARTLPKAQIPPKYRPLVYGLHTLYMDTLKPAQKSVDWKTVLGFMNSRDIAQMLFVVNWEARKAAEELGIKNGIPLEPPASVGTEVTTTVEAVAPADVKVGVATQVTDETNTTTTSGVSV